MSQVIRELATIDVSNEAARQLDLAGIYRSFSENYKKLDGLKEFRSEYDKQNGLMRWWHNDKLRDAQLNSAEVQGEFSKTIGQLMLISIMQSKELATQQLVLQEQQGKLATQADEIADQAGKLQQQQHKLAEQSTALKTVVEEYIALKGMTEEGMQKLVAVARDIKATKDSLVQHVDERTRDLEAHFSGATARLHAMETELQAHHASQASDLAQVAQRLEQSAGAQRADADGLRTHLAQIADGLAASNAEAAAGIKQQQAMQADLDGLRETVARQARRSRHLAAGLAVVAIGLIASVAHIVGWG